MSTRDPGTSDMRKGTELANSSALTGRKACKGRICKASVTVKVSRKSATPETADFKSNSGLAMLRKEELKGPDCIDCCKAQDKKSGLRP